MRFVLCMIFSFFTLCSPAVATVTLEEIVPLTSGLPFDRPGHSQIAFNSKHNEFLIVYEYYNELFPAIHEIHATRRAPDGSYKGFFKIGETGRINVRPDVSYDPVRDQYMITWLSYTNSNSKNAKIMAARVPWSGPPKNPVFNTVININTSPLMEGGVYCVPRIAFNSIDNTFLIITPYKTPPSTNINIAGIRLNAVNGSFVGSGNLDFKFNPGQAKYGLEPDMVYNQKANEFFIVFSNYQDIFGLRIAGATGKVVGQEIPLAAWPGEERFPWVNYLPTTDQYLVSWSGRSSEQAGYDVYGRMFTQNGSANGAVIGYSNDPSSHNYLTSVVCDESGAECSAFWLADKDNNLYMMQRSFKPGLTVDGQKNLHYLGKARNLRPFFIGIGAASGINSFFISYVGFDNNNVQLLFGRGGKISNFTLNPIILNPIYMLLL